jgi:SAM-dependent methyltransferase
LLRDRLLLDVLSWGLVTHPVLERLLIALRRVLLCEVAAPRFADPHLMTVATALLRQCWANEFVWDETQEETTALAALSTQAIEETRGDPDRLVLLGCLYRPAGQVVGRQTILRLRSDELRDALLARLDEEDEIGRQASTLPRLAPITDALSTKVARQYEASPYPRWRSVRVYPNNRYFKYLETYFSGHELAFARNPFEVLISGCGTGRQAVSAALDYGPSAHITAIDLSAASLGYAATMSQRFGVGNATFLQGDLLQIDEVDPSFLQRFHVIECSGVLHHMADPVEAWRRLLRCLAPGGIMLTGLYSAVARRDLDILAREPIYPGPACDDHALRRYRAQLLSRPANAPGSAFRSTRDFHSASGFRDFFLHVNEHRLDLQQIGAFLSANGVEFRGFVNAPFEALRARFPDESRPGRLERWADLEREQPATFIGMYQFWCTRTAAMTLICPDPAPRA